MGRGRGGGEREKGGACKRTEWQQNGKSVKHIATKEIRVDNVREGREGEGGGGEVKRKMGHPG